MADIVIKTNGTVEGTKLIVDGEEVSKNEKIISIDLYASAPYTSQYSGDTYPGHISIGYEKVGQDGTIERTSLFSSPDRSKSGIGQKIKTEDQVIRYIGADADAKISSFVDTIISHCKTNKIPVQSKEVLLNRTIESLQDKMEDLGIKLEDVK